MPEFSPRFVVVVVSAYIGMYRKTDPTAWAIADREKANSIVSRKFPDQTSAQLEADRLNAFHSLDEFTHAYIDCALWSSMDESTPQGGEPLDANYCADDLSPETLQRMIDDCAMFQVDNAADLALAGNSGQNGHDFWLTRNGHGAGFWDRGYGNVGDRLTAAAHAWGSFDLYVGDDDLIYGS